MINIILFPQPKKQELSDLEKIALKELEDSLIQYQHLPLESQQKYNQKRLNALLKSGEIYVKENNFLKAKEIFDELINKKERITSIHSYAWLINLTYWQKDFSSCEKYTKQLMNLEPKTKDSCRNILAKISLEEFYKGNP
jgi:tetratricopeptide (TPR) repeat protein